MKAKYTQDRPGSCSGANVSKDRNHHSDASQRIPYSDMISGGRYDMRDVIQPIYDAVNEQYGINETQE